MENFILVFPVPSWAFNFLPTSVTNWRSVDPLLHPNCVAHPVPQHTDENLQPPLVQQVLPLLGVEADHPAPPGLVGGILPVRSNAGFEDRVGLAGLQETAGLDLEITE